jgi:16S rRNA (cytosine1402-N4)-methyltransferase
MEVNQELNNLKNVLSQIPPLVNYLGTVAVITFHSLEDRIVKSAFTN